MTFLFFKLLKKKNCLEIFIHSLLTVAMLRCPTENIDDGGICAFYFMSRELKFYFTDM